VGDGAADADARSAIAMLRELWELRSALRRTTIYRDNHPSWRFVDTSGPLLRAEAVLWHQEAVAQSLLLAHIESMAATITDAQMRVAEGAVLSTIEKSRERAKHEQEQRQREADTALGLGPARRQTVSAAKENANEHVSGEVPTSRGSPGRITSGDARRGRRKRTAKEKDHPNTR